MRKIVATLLLLLVLSGCGWVYELGNGKSSEFDISSANIQVAPFEFINEAGEGYGTEQLEGQYWLANMIFTSCPTVCPTMTPNMQRLQTAMLDDEIPVTFVSFTVDPETDSPEVLQSYGTNVGADLDSWHFLSGYSSDEISDFAKESFATVVQDPGEEDIIHPTSFFLVDPSGKVVRKYNGLQANQEDIIADLKATIE